VPVAAVLLAPILPGQTAGDDLSVEEILRTQITSVGRKGQQVAKAPAAVYVITQEDIRRSGATNIPDLLRMVPGLVVARINGSTWAISARGDARQYSNKMLVLIDGRSVYERLFSGVFWNAQDVLLEDIDRIEVIRGTGAVMHITLALPRTRTMLDQNSSFNRPFACSTAVRSWNRTSSAFSRCNNLRRFSSACSGFSLASIRVESREIGPISLSLLRLFDQRRMQPPRQITFGKLRERSRKRRFVRIFPLALPAADAPQGNIGRQPLQQLPRGTHVVNCLGYEGPRNRLPIFRRPAHAAPPPGDTHASRRIRFSTFSTCCCFSVKGANSSRSAGNKAPWHTRMN